MTLQEFESRGQDYADLRDALREIATLRAVHVELLSVCEGVRLALRYPRGSEAQVRCLEEIGQEAALAIAKARKEVAS